MFSNLTTYTSIKILQISCEGHRQHIIHVHGLIETLKSYLICMQCVLGHRGFNNLLLSAVKFAKFLVVQCN